MTSSSSGFEPTLDLLRTLLDAQDAPPDVLLHRARTASYLLPPLVLSVADREGHRLGTGSEDEVRRHRERIALYRKIAELAVSHGARVVKGPALARFLPPWVVRTSGDLDLLAPGEAVLWKIALAVEELFGARELILTLAGWGAGAHLMVGLVRAAEDPWLDRELCVEIATFAYPGDFERVPLRAAMPARESTAQLLAVAEERLQRTFGVRDALDCLAVLTSAEAPDPAELAEAATAWSLAPELLELVELAEDAAGAAAAVPAAHRTALAGPAAAERARRDEIEAVPGPEGETRPERMRRLLAAGGPVAERLRAAFPVFGMPLRSGTGFAPADRATVYEDGDLIVLTTPLDAFLLVTEQVVAPDRYRRAQELAARLATAQRGAVTAGSGQS
ncbi:hypothetical protein [Amycolatopsis sp. NPDC051102]|uniref:hypothetical protein n=1 Tax=Amycolatopsis sp. NPDC051102 TaxID=3155163 RepID=UPI00342E46BA